MRPFAADEERTIFRPTPLQELRAGHAPTHGTLFLDVGRTDDAARGADIVDPSPILDEDMPEPPPRARPRNLMLEAATPLLALISAVRSGRFTIELSELHRKAIAAASRFDEALRGAGYPPETQRRARYAVFATVDDVAQNLPGRAADGAEWARRSMVVRGFGENIGGDRFWMLLHEMLAHPSGNVELIELYHACLAAGFEGRHRVSDNGRSRLRGILTSAYAALPHVRSLSDTEIAPNWRGHPTPRNRAGVFAPLVLAASILVGGLLLLLLVMRLVLVEAGQPSLAAIDAINPDEPLRLARPYVAAPPPESAQDARLSRLLAPEIAQKLVTLDQDPTSLRIRTTVGQLFRSGSDTLEPGRRALFERIAAAVAREKGGIRIEGHADSDRVATLTFPDNQALSEARAEAVARIFRTIIADPARITAQGYGATRPIASNATATGKALNRRVEIVVPRSS